MKKIGILTLNGYFNYGNRLQNYALQEILKRLGFNVETIINDTNFSNQNGGSSNRMGKIKKIREKNMKELYEILFKKAENYLYKNKLDQQKTQIFKVFWILYIDETEFSF